MSSTLDVLTELDLTFEAVGFIFSFDADVEVVVTTFFLLIACDSVTKLQDTC